LFFFSSQDVPVFPFLFVRVGGFAPAARQYGRVILHPGKPYKSDT